MEEKYSPWYPICGRVDKVHLDTEASGLIMSGITGYCWIGVQERCRRRGRSECSLSEYHYYLRALKPFACNSDSCLILCIVLASWVSIAKVI